PRTLDEARMVLRDLGDKAVPIAGGTALHFLPDEEPRTAVDLTRLGLSGIREEKGGYTIGATTTLADIMDYRAPDWAFHETTRRTSTHQIRNVSTVGGNIARVFPWADLPVALLALDARMIIQDQATREMAADEYFASQPARLFKNGTLLTGVRVPSLGEGMGFGYHKEVRTFAGFSLMTAAAVLTLDGNRIAQARLAVGAGVPLPRRLPDVEKSLVGQPAEAEAFEKAVAGGIADVSWKGREGMSDEYARHLAQVVLNDVLSLAAAYAEGRRA
ncbi:MAG: FAD binding domain-containing protein, partial [Kiritimatiellae bacterium]|nr:FAD binding domain-containing protein [Kiritimatiellia bacterium]